MHRVGFLAIHSPSQLLKSEEYLFQTVSDCCFMCFKQLRPLKGKGLASNKDESFLTNDLLNRVIDWIPGMKGIRVRDLQRFYLFFTKFPVFHRNSTVMYKEQLIEYGTGLAESNHSFSAIFPAEFLEETKRGFSGNWCPQEEVLNTPPSIGGFITHCGRDSTIERVSSGQTNYRYTCNEWGIGMEIGNDIKREQVKELVRELMEAEKGKKIKKQAVEWKKLAEEATAPNGIPSMTFDKLVNEVLLVGNLEYVE
uniref:Anthocyanidin 3-O-glucosyltransferase n=1 Tax=Salix viminalis TaxID=40686 RepID=A0A6N2LN58_SALVM